MKRTLAALLGRAGGAVDAIGYLMLFRIFTAQMSGNTVTLAVAAARDDVRTIAERAAAIAAFTAGTIIGAFIVELLKRRAARFAFAATIATEIALLCAFWIAGAAVGFLPSEGSGMYYLLLATATLAMGTQNATLREVGGTPVHTTFVTGVLTNIGEAVAGMAASRFFDGERNLDARRALAVLAPVYAGYLCGGLAAAAIFIAQPAFAPALAFVPLVGVGVYGAVRDPIAGD